MKHNLELVYRNPLKHSDLLTVYVNVHDSELSNDWIAALEKIIDSDLHLEKNYCFLGFPHTPRNVAYLCERLNQAVNQINQFACTGTWTQAGLENYYIEEYFCDESVRFGLDWPAGDHPKSTGRLGGAIKHDIMNRLHNHFEILQGTVENISRYYQTADTATRYAIRQLNVVCHELENVILAQRKMLYQPEWVRPSQINTWIHAPRYELTDQHRTLFAENRYDRRFGWIYMHWCQIGKTLFEVFRDEGAPELDAATCEAITHLRYYSGEFDIEWGRDVVEGADCIWHDDQLQKFRQWLISNGFDPADPQLSLGHLPIAHVDLDRSFGTQNTQEIWQILGKHLDLYQINLNGKSKTYNYCWSDADFEQTQMEIIK